MESSKIYWWNGAENKNFGDVLGPALFEHFTNKKAEWAEAKDSELVIIGSIVEHLPKPYEGTIAGIGFGYPKIKRDLSKTNVLALRGELSFEASGLKEKPILADPGLLAPELITNDGTKSHKIGVIGHHKHQTIKVPEGGLFIDIKWPIEDVILAAASCEEIHSSSLHGIILADSLDIPRKWVLFNKVQGGGHKFHDYFSSLGEKTMPDEIKKVDFKRVQKKQDELREMFRCL
jgi:pyruvyltransferase